MGDRMDEQTIVRVLIFNGFTGLRNQLRRLVDTDRSVTERKHNILFNIICIMGLFDISSGTVECQMLSQLKRLV